MYEIRLDDIYRLRARVAKSEAEIERAIEAKNRTRSEGGLKKAEAEIARLKVWKDRYEESLAEYEAEAEEAKKMAAAGGEVVLARVWVDDYGRRDGGVNRSLWKSVAEAEAVYNEIKDGNGGYVEAWIEVRKAGEFNRIKELKEKIAAFEAELGELSGND